MVNLALNKREGASRDIILSWKLDEKRIIDSRKGRPKKIGR